MESNMWRVSLRDEGGSNIIPSDNCNNTGGAMPFPKFLANNIYECKNITKLIKFYHATLGYPAISTWRKAIKFGYFQGWPGLTSNRVHQFIKVCDKTEKGHMDQQRKGTRYTKCGQDDQDSMATVPQTPTNNWCNHVYMKIS